MTSDSQEVIFQKHYFLSCLAVLIFVLLPMSSRALDVPDFLDINDISDAEFTCLTDSVEYSLEEQKYIDMLWDESLTYLKAIALALTNDEISDCINSDEAIYETAGGIKRMCIMDRRDMQSVVKNIYQVVNNPDKAKKCFSARRDVDWIYSPGGQLEANSPVAKWLQRTTFMDFFDNKVTNDKVRQYGHEFTEHFYKMVTGPDIKMPAGFPYDVSANALPNLWAAAGWYPMYAQESERNKKNFLDVRGGYAYAEVFGHWGLLRIDTINGEKVGAEIGMTAQSVDTFYPAHNHATSEFYYTLRKPSCPNQFKTIAAREDNDLVKELKENDEKRVVTFDLGMFNGYKNFTSSSASRDSLVYFYPNTIHAFDVDGSCEANPEEKALVSVWGRIDAHDKRNDYGTTLLCEDHANKNTPAEPTAVVECDLTKVKW